jgi:hypothetical protein
VLLLVRPPMEAFGRSGECHVERLCHVLKTETIPVLLLQSEWS